MAGVIEPSRDTHTATDHKGTSPFPKEGRSKAPANNMAIAYHGVSTRQTPTCRRTCSKQAIASYYKANNV